MVVLKDSRGMAARGMGDEWGRDEGRGTGDRAFSLPGDNRGVLSKSLVLSSLRG